MTSLSDKSREQNVLKREIRRVKKEIEKKTQLLGRFTVEISMVASAVRHQESSLAAMEKELAELRS